MPKVFFGHASEDKPVVEAVYAALVKAHPDVEPWVDKYEIVGGQDFFERIAKGMDEAEKFFVFLSPVSLTKPWVDRELKRALAQEVGGKKDFIVPVLIDDIPAVPDFLEHKHYVDLRGTTELEAVEEIHAAITGTAPGPGAPVDNIGISVRQGSAPNIAEVVFSVKAFAEPASVWVKANQPMRARTAHFDPPMAINSLRDNENDPFEYFVAAEFPRIERGRSFIVEITFDAGVDAVDAIVDASRATLT